VVPFPGTTFSGVISGTGGLNVIGSGANFGYFYLNGNNSYTGTTTVSGATLGGTGSIAGPVTVDSSSAMSVLAPGLPMSPFVGILNTGAVSFVGGATFSASMRGPNPGSGYTQLNVTGSVNLTNANLVTQLASSPAPVLGQVYTIINATGPVSGTFVSYPEGTLINFGFATLSISYQGGGGTQVTLTVVAVAASSFSVSGFPSPVTAEPLAASHQAQDSSGNVVTGYTGTVHFTSSDAQAVLPANYTFTAADAGQHTFNATLETAGSQSLTATDTGPYTITGSQTGITVNAAAANSLVVSGFPSTTTAGVAGSFTVTAKDPYSNIATVTPAQSTSPAATFRPSCRPTTPSRAGTPATITLARL